MNHNKTYNIDLSGFKEKIFNLFYFDSENCGKNIEDFIEINNVFGWNVAKAKVWVDLNTNEINEFKLLTNENIIQAKAKKNKSKKLIFWRFEFISRELKYSPDAFEPSLEKFLKFFYTVYLDYRNLYEQDVSLPESSFEISKRGIIKAIRYSLMVNDIYTKPLFHITVNDDNFIQSITDWQSIDSKHIIYPTLDFLGSYVLQKFSNVQHKNLYKEELTKDTKIYSIIFKGFSDYEVNYIADKELEVELKKYGFFITELRSIISDTELLLAYIPTVNYHLIKNCNMLCKHCFSDFSELSKNNLDLISAKEIINEVSKINSFRKLNFSGGEPTIFKDIEVLINYAKEKGLETSMVTNGFFLVNNPILFNKMKNNLDLLVLSIDSFDKNTNIKIGRSVQNKTISYDELLTLSENCHRNGIKIKINTVITKTNFKEKIAEFIVNLKPLRWKIFRMLPVKNQNNIAFGLHPTNEEYEHFLNNNMYIAEKFGVKVVAENNEEMTGSYLMISPDGRFFNNIEGVHNYSDPILEVGIKKALSQTPLLREVFYKREGDYSCL